MVLNMKTMNIEHEKSFLIDNCNQFTKEEF